MLQHKFYQNSKWFSPKTRRSFGFTQKWAGRYAEVILWYTIRNLSVFVPFLDPVLVLMEHLGVVLIGFQQLDSAGFCLQKLFQVN